MKTHWKKTIDKDWIGTYILPEEKPIIVKLISVKYQEVKVKGVKDWYKVAYFAKNQYFDKPMLLSASKNLKRIEDLTGSPYIEDWVKLDLWVTLRQEMDKAFGGGKDWALRIAPEKPTLPEELTPNHKKWALIVKAVKDGSTIEQVRTKFILSKENENKLKEQIK